ncbi:ATP-binding protein [Synechococcus sp. 1G10]|uniref:ATP-binding protein n=1 Tax=Synechococcus sp. 1G10 TaxID=2025605 RepID=UPI000B99847C|nr:ATP-binding protein [Synechococcus sp. 1G10]
MTRNRQQTKDAGASTNPGSDQTEIQRLVEDLDGMLSRLRLGAIREQLDGLLEEAARQQLNLREALAWLCAAEVASKKQRRLSMAMTIAHFPCVRTLEGFEFEADGAAPSDVRAIPLRRVVSDQMHRKTSRGSRV